MELLQNLSQLSKRGLLELPSSPEERYKIVQYPDGFLKVEDTERAFGITSNPVEAVNVSIELFPVKIVEYCSVILNA